jgi:hypothetical protein
VYIRTPIPPPPSSMRDKSLPLPPSLSRRRCPHVTSTSSRNAIYFPPSHSSCSTLSIPTSHSSPSPDPCVSRWSLSPSSLEHFPLRYHHHPPPPSAQKSANPKCQKIASFIARLSPVAPLAFLHPPIEPALFSGACTHFGSRIFVSDDDFDSSLPAATSPKLPPPPPSPELPSLYSASNTQNQSSLTSIRNCFTTALSFLPFFKHSRKVLVVGGLSACDSAGHDAIRAWCEDFGHIRHFSRKPNGNVHVDFKKASVADTVCRVKAQVYIRGAGSVSLSWSTEKRSKFAFCCTVV